jgi:hypothetical protein
MAEVPVFEEVDVDNVWLRGETLEQGVVLILVVRVKHGKLVGGIEFTAQQEGEGHKDSRLYWGSWGVTVRPQCHVISKSGSVFSHRSS